MLLPSNPKAGYLAHRQEIDQAIQQVLEGGWYILGKQVEEFERKFAAFVGVNHAIGVGSGTEAIHLALRAAGIGIGDSVVTVSNTAVATVAAIELAGATPILVDCDPQTFTLDPGALSRVLARPDGSRIKAVIPVHLFGHPADMPAILDLARQYGLRVIEDCAQAHGAALQDRQVGAWGDLAAFSFYPTKNLGALGDGGGVVTNDAGLAEQCKLLRQYGWRERYISEISGMNTRLDEIQAAVLAVKLPYLEQENGRRRELAEYYNRRLAGTSIVCPAVRPGVRHVFHQYVIRHPKRDQLRAHLVKHEVGTQILYPVPIHAQPAYQGRVRVGPGGLPNTDLLAGEILSLPLYPQLTDADASRVADLIVAWHPR